MNEPLPGWLAAELDRIPEAKAHGDVDALLAPSAVAARYNVRSKFLELDFDNGARLCLPPALLQGLEGATPAQLKAVELTPLGTAVHFPALDVDLLVSGLLHGVFGSANWHKRMAAKGGQSRSSSKASAARANGSKGGRPRRGVAKNA